VPLTTWSCRPDSDYYQNWCQLEIKSTVPWLSLQRAQSVHSLFCLKKQKLITSRGFRGCQRKQMVIRIINEYIQIALKKILYQCTTVDTSIH